MNESPALTRRSALIFVLLFGLVSLFADMTYEGARSVLGPYLRILGASAAVVGFVSGLGEFVGYGFRIVSGVLADRTRRYWLITILGYTLNLLAVPLLALTGNWVSASILILLERFGKSIRNPARDAMLSFARDRVGSGWTYGLHEALDQVGAVAGPLIVAGVLSWKGGNYHFAFAILLAPALISLTLVGINRALYRNPSKLEVKKLSVASTGMNRQFWIYIAAVGSVAFGFADFTLVSYHFQARALFSAELIPIVYAVAMGVDAFSALLFGALYDRIGSTSLAAATAIGAFFAPLTFLFGTGAAWAGIVLWGISMGAQESIMRSVVADMAPRNRRASAFGLFNAGYGLFWFAGSTVMGILYGVSLPALVIVSMVAQFAAIPLIFLARRQAPE